MLLCSSLVVGSTVLFCALDIAGSFCHHAIKKLRIRNNCNNWASLCNFLELGCCIQFGCIQDPVCGV
uniref:Secreted protein n=1 Tax=Arundo donax TaxID=35708 RepID=A0A0A9EG83_ARUDO